MTAKKQWTLEDISKTPVGKGIATAEIAALLPHGTKYADLQRFLRWWGVPVSCEYLRNIVSMGNRAKAVHDRMKQFP